MSQILGAQTSERISVDRLEALRCRKEPEPHKALGSKPSEQAGLLRGEDARNKQEQNTQMPSFPCPHCRRPEN